MDSLLVKFLFAVQSLFNVEERVYSCELCHLPNNWEYSVQFNHSKTFFDLSGVHSIIECKACHIGLNLQETHDFKNVNTQCNECHIDPHAFNFGSMCERCHEYTDWLTIDYYEVHNNSFFPLIGGHSTVQCKACHISNIFESIPSIACNNCHAYSDDSETHNSSSTFCEMCHNPFSWSPIQDGLHDIRFPIYSGTHNGEWDDCNICHTNETNYLEFSCGLNGGCHEHNEKDMYDEHSGKTGYIYDSIACFSCHPRGDE